MAVFMLPCFEMKNFKKKPPVNGQLIYKHEKAQLYQLPKTRTMIFINKITPANVMMKIASRFILFFMKGIVDSIKVNTQHEHHVSKLKILY